MVLVIFTEVRPYIVLSFCCCIGGHTSVALDSSCGESSSSQLNTQLLNHGGHHLTQKQLGEPLQTRPGRTGAESELLSSQEETKLLFFSHCQNAKVTLKVVLIISHMFVI